MVTEETKRDKNVINEMQSLPNREEELTIDLMELFYAWKRRWLAILACVVVLGGVMGV